MLDDTTSCCVASRSVPVILGMEILLPAQTGLTNRLVKELKDVQTKYCPSPENIS